MWSAHNLEEKKGLRVNHLEFSSAALTTLTVREGNKLLSHVAVIDTVEDLENVNKQNNHDRASKKHRTFRQVRPQVPEILTNEVKVTVKYIFLVFKEDIQHCALFQYVLI